MVLRLADIMGIDKVAGILSRPETTVERRLKILRRRQRMFQRPGWTEAEVAVLEGCATVEEAIEQLSGSRAVRAITAKYQRLKSGRCGERGKGWSAEEDEVLKGLWGTKTRAAIGTILGRSPASVSYRAWFLKLSQRAGDR